MSLPLQAIGQGATERQALKNIQKGKWKRSYDQLHKTLTKDTADIAAAYVMAEYFFAPENPGFNIDSAYRYLDTSIRGYGSATVRTRERLNRFPLDSTMLHQLRHHIDSAAFNRAKQLNTESAYTDFLVRFPQAVQQDSAVKMRDQAAFDEVSRINTHQAFAEFIRKYPQSKQADAAQKKFERLKFEDLTSDKKLTSYIAYLAAYPNTPYRQVADQHIFEISTAAGSITAYKSFLEAYPGSYFKKRAEDILFHLLPDDYPQDHFPDYFSDHSLDSLTVFIHDDRDYIVPFLHEGKFGFMDQRGRKVFDTEEEELNAIYKCGNINEDVIVLQQKLVAFNGAVIANRIIESIDDIGYGFLFVEANGCGRVLHKTGFEIGDDCIAEAKILNGKLLALRKDLVWSVWTLTGRKLLPFAWDGIATCGDVVALKTRDRFALAKVESIAGIADQRELGLEDFADEIRPWRKNLIWVKNEGQEALLDQQLDTVIRQDYHLLQQTYFGTTVTRPGDVRIVNDNGDASATFKKIVVQEPWTAVKDKRWYLFDPDSGRYKTRAYDSIFFTGPIAVGTARDSITVYFPEGNSLAFKLPVRTEFVPGKDSSSFLLVERAEKKSLYTMKGRKLFTVSYDKIQYAGEGFFTVHKKEKKGLMTSAGKVILPMEYDAIGSVDNGVVSLLKAMKFGLFDCKRKKLIKPQYDKNLVVYNANNIVAYRDGLYGFVGWDNKPVIAAEFDEVRYWNDSSAMVRKDSRWMIVEIRSKQVVLDDIRDLKFIQDGDEKLAIVKHGLMYGVIHNTKGTIIPLSFSDIVNVGSREQPLYFTEKHVEEASIFVVIYYDAAGTILRKEVYEQEDYEKIYCSNN